MTESRGELTRTFFAMIPIDLLNACVDHHGTAMVYLRLWYYSEKLGYFPEEEEMAEECGLTVEELNEALDWLAAQGWLLEEGLRLVTEK